MFLSNVHLLSFISAALITALSSPASGGGSYKDSSIIRRDVIIIGGGSSGTYAAIRLRDKGKSVVVVEAKDVLGGHTNTYRDPATKTPVDYGVIVFDNTSIVTNYFSRFNIPLTVGTGRANVQESYVDFSTGENVTTYVPPDPTKAFAAFAAQLQKYPSLNKPGWNVPDPVPADLLLPFGDFVKKYKLDGAVPTIYFFAQGFGDILRIPTLYFVQYFSPSFLQEVQRGFLVTTRHDNSELYEKARAELGDSVLLNTKILHTHRTGPLVRVHVHTPTGPKLLLAPKLLITIPPLPSLLSFLDLTPTEHTLFTQFTSSALYTGLLRNTGLPASVEITAVGAHTPYNLPSQSPTLYGLYSTALPRIKQFLLSNPTPLNATTIHTSITNHFPKAEFVAVSDHAPYELRVSAQAIKAGFYRKLMALQGEGGTWWTGAAFDRHDSGSLWGFTEGVVGRMVG
ncbi:MAG: hypothetical protein Q9195_005221 [Heterodermia aff. obscurata]